MSENDILYEDDFRWYKNIKQNYNYNLQYI